MKKTCSFNKSAFTALACVLALIATAALLVLRAPYGLDLTDEPYYSALAYRLLLGDRLFVDAWELHQISAYLTVPFLALYRAVTGGLDGVLLYYRYMFILAQLVLSLYCFRVLSHRYGKVCGIVLALMTLLHAHYTLNGLSYCNMGPMFVLLAGLFWIRACDAKRPAVFHALSGAAYALAVGVYPSYVISLPFVILYLILYLRKRTPDRSAVARYFALGIASVVAAFAAALFARSTPLEVIAGIRGMLGDPDHQSEGLFRIVFGFPNYVRVLFSYAAYLALMLFVLALAAPRLPVGLRTRIEAFLPYLFLLTVILASVRVFSAAYEPYHKGNLAVMIPALLFPAAFLFSDKKDDPAVFLFVLGALLVLGVQIGSNTHFRASSGSTLPASVASAAFLTPFFKKLRARRIDRVLIGVACVCCLASVGYWRFNTIYRDEPISDLTATVVSGPAKGCITTEQRAHAVETLCSEVRETEAEEGCILVVRLMPIAYLASHQRPAVPSMFNMRPDSAWLADYLAAHPDRIPTRICWIDKALDTTNEAPNDETLAFASDYAAAECETMTVYTR